LNWKIKNEYHQSDLIWKNLGKPDKVVTLKRAFFYTLLAILSLAFLTPTFVGEALLGFSLQLSKYGGEDNQISAIITEYSQPIVVILINVLQY